MFELDASVPSSFPLDRLIRTGIGLASRLPLLVDCDKCTRNKVTCRSSTVLKSIVFSEDVFFLDRLLLLLLFLEPFPLFDLSTSSTSMCLLHLVPSKLNEIGAHSLPIGPLCEYKYNVSEGDIFKMALPAPAATIVLDVFN